MGKPVLGCTSVEDEIESSLGVGLICILIIELALNHVIQIYVKLFIASLFTEDNSGIKLLKNQMSSISDLSSENGKSFPGKSNSCLL